jgi:hypothetical protein
MMKYHYIRLKYSRIGSAVYQDLENKGKLGEHSARVTFVVLSSWAGALVGAAFGGAVGGAAGVYYSYFFN